MHEATRIARHVAHAKAKEEKQSMDDMLANGDYEGLKVFKIKELSELCKQIGVPTYGEQRSVRPTPPQMGTHVFYDMSTRCISSY